MRDQAPSFFNHALNFLYLYFLTFCDVSYQSTSSFSPLETAWLTPPSSLLTCPSIGSHPISSFSPAPPKCYWSSHLPQQFNPILSLQFPHPCPSRLQLILCLISSFLCVSDALPLCFPCFPSPSRALPGVSYSEASPLSDALVDHQLAEKTRGASWRQFRGRGAPLSSPHTWDFGRLQLQVHVLLERPDTGVHINV